LRSSWGATTALVEKRSGMGGRAARVKMQGIRVGSDGANGAHPLSDPARRLFCAVVLRAVKDARSGGSQAGEAKRWLRQVAPEIMARI